MNGSKGCDVEEICHSAGSQICISRLAHSSPAEQSASVAGRPTILLEDEQRSVFVKDGPHREVTVCAGNAGTQGSNVSPSLVP